MATLIVKSLMKKAPKPEDLHKETDEAPAESEDASDADGEEAAKVSAFDDFASALNSGDKSKAREYLEDFLSYCR
jgi:hypothetical protein